MLPQGEPQPGFLLFVDDESELVGAVGAMLKVVLADEEVRATSDPGEALRWLRKARPSVLVTDARMPEVSGIELILAAQELWGATPSILITAFPDQHGFEPRGCGHLLCLPKPFSFFSLHEMIRKVRASAAPRPGSLEVLANLVQLLAISSSSGVLSVESAERKGELHFHQGRLVQISAQGEAGAPAFGEMLGWAEGRVLWKKSSSVDQVAGYDLAELLAEAPEREPSARRSSAPARPRSWGRGAVRSSPVRLPERLQKIEGFLGAALVDSDRELLLGVLGDDESDLAWAASSNAEVVRAKRRTAENLGMRDEIEDMLITLGKQYHLIRPLRARPGVFFYLAIDRSRANLAMARMTLAAAEEELGAA